jgi:hypothetical protein
MAFDNNQKSGNGDPNAKRKSEEHLPRYFRTVPNSKFLSSTLDQLIQPGSVEQLLHLIKMIIMLVIFQLADKIINLNQLLLLKIV